MEPPSPPDQAHGDPWGNSGGAPLPRSGGAALPPPPPAAPGGRPPGSPDRPASAPEDPAPRRSRLAVAALVVAVLGLLVPVLGGAVAMLLGIVALVRVAASKGTRTGTVMASGAVLMGFVAILAWLFVLARSDAFQTMVTEFREGFEEGIAAEGLQISSELDVGDCLDIELVEDAPLLVTEKDVVPCDGVHAAEYLGSVDDPAAPDEDWPGDDAIFEQHLPACITHFEDAVGRAWDDAVELDVFLLLPDERGWNVGDREVACFVIAFDGSDLTEQVMGHSTDG